MTSGSTPLGAEPQVNAVPQESHARLQQAADAAERARVEADCQTATARRQLAEQCSALTRSCQVHGTGTSHRNL